MFRIRKPRAMPWATLGRTVGAGFLGCCDPTAMPWVTLGRTVGAWFLRALQSHGVRGGREFIRGMTPQRGNLT
ncbi:hypothetical protein Fuma_04611 [Fuerstiella marisgermanici]|uniref:Uncharacterized protein n=1 Tax=Fuerstiella marisgermanici TaxID=1891926 RepID=A0A1P8WLM9_9PLAN|nr:hypothetical protein Fuma_04611 [Fuerstiella marisgermanici]